MSGVKLHNDDRVIVDLNESSDFIDEVTYTEDFDILYTRTGTTSNDQVPDRVIITVDKEGDYAVEIGNYLGAVFIDSSVPGIQLMESGTLLPNAEVVIMDSAAGTVASTDASDYVNITNATNDSINGGYQALTAYTGQSAFQNAIALTRFKTKKVACDIPLYYYAITTLEAGVTAIGITGLTEASAKATLTFSRQTS